MTRSHVAAFALSLFVFSTASAQWPMQSRSPGRAAASPNAGELATPAIGWRHYLGGSVGNDALVAHDVDADGRAEVIYISGGKLVCKRDDGRLVWETEPFGLTRIHAVEDLDGDGTLELLASGRPAILAVFSLAEGTLLWRTQRSYFGVALGPVLLGQLVPGGPREVYTADRMGGDTNSRPDAVYAYTFAGGFGSGRPDATTTLWTGDASHRSDPRSGDDVLADLDGDGTPEVVSFDEQRALEEGFLHIYEGADGARRGPIGGYPMGIPLARGLTRVSRVVDIDGDGDDEIVVATNSNGYSPVSRNSRAIFVIDWDSTRPAGTRLYVRWSHRVPSISTDDHRYSTANVADLDLDGTMEVISTFVEGGVTTTYVFDGVTGATRTTLPGAVFRGAIQLDPVGGATVLATEGGMLRGYRWSGGALAERFAIPDRAVAWMHPREWAALSRAFRRPITMPLPADPTRQGILTSTSDTLELWDPAAPAAPVAAFTVSVPLEISNWAPQTGVGGTESGLLVARSDGFLDVVDGSLTRPPAGEFAARGLRIGGYYSGRLGLARTPLGAPVGSGGHSVFVIDGRGDLVRLDVGDATLTLPPIEAWRWPGIARPVLLDRDGDGTYEEVVVQSGTSIVGRSTADGTTETFAVADVRASGDIFSGDHVPLATPTGVRFAVPIRDAAGDAKLRAVDRTGIVWTSVAVRSGSSISGYLAADDIDGDGYDDALLALMTFRAVFGDDGSDHLFAPTASYPAMPIVIGGRSAGAVTHIAAGGTMATALTITGDTTGVARTNVWSYPSDLNTLRHFATLVECPETKLAGALAETSLLGVADIATHTDGAPPTIIALVGGRGFPDLDAALAAGLYPGALGNAASIADLDGTGRPAVLIGSTDGYLYVVDACASPPALIWSLNLRSPVGEPILLDTDGDGMDEIVVSVQDGFLYGIDEEVFPRPDPVLDIIPGGATDVDVDETRALGLAAAWAAVPGALGYEWAVFTAGGTPVSRNPTDPTNPFSAVAAGITTVEYGEGLEDGAVYFFAVRALGAEGSSSEALSDGTRFILTAPMTPDAGMMMGVDGGPTGTDAGPGDGSDDGGCGCRALGGGSTTSVPWFLFALLVARRRRG